MSDYRQPWRRVVLAGRRCHLQVVDPQTAFDLEPDLVRVLGDTLSFAVSAPSELLGAVWRRSAAGATDAASLRALMEDPDEGPVRAAQTIASLGTVLAECIKAADLDVAWVRRTFGALVLGRLRVGDEGIETVRDWQAAGFRPRAKWQAMAAQVQQSFGPLWMREPYRLRTPTKDYGVPAPKSIPVAVRYAHELAKTGVASSSEEILNRWTPLRMIEAVESQTYTAEVERRANEAARNGGG